ncbi:hypothetical protein GGS21DRAFT_489365 [Xylaria nigripes]|nr:hypothetical protein GGS21DRAFT_489365 [Xylaria nigripes]
MGRSADYVISGLAALDKPGTRSILGRTSKWLLADDIEDVEPTVIIIRTAHVDWMRSHVSLMVLNERELGTDDGSQPPP